MDLSKLMQQAQKMQEQMKASQDELKKIKIEAASGGGMVKVTMSGEYNVLNVSIEDTVLNDKEMLEDLFMAAINLAVDKVKSKTEEEMQKKTGDMLGGMNLGGFKFPGM